MTFNGRINSIYAIFISLWNTLNSDIYLHKFNCHMPTRTKGANHINIKVDMNFLLDHGNSLIWP